MIEVARGVYRRTWYVNQLALRRNGEIVARLAAAGVPSLIFKGFALAILNYRDLGARPMEDLDLIVDPDQVDDAVRALEPMGFSPSPGSEVMSGLLTKDRHVTDRDGNAVELHAYSLVASADDSDLWERRVALKLLDVEAFAPCAADSLLLVCAHGMLWPVVQQVSWLVDAAAIVRSSSDPFDWDRFVERAVARRFTQLAARAVRMLTALDVDVPAGVVRRLEAEPVDWRYRIADRAMRGPINRRKIAVGAWNRYLRFRDLAPPGRRPSGVRDWLADRWRLDADTGLAAETGRRVLSLHHWVRGERDSHRA